MPPSCKHSKWNLSMVTPSASWLWLPSPQAGANVIPMPQRASQSLRGLAQGWCPKTVAWALFSTVSSQHHVTAKVWGSLGYFTKKLHHTASIAQSPQSSLPQSPVISGPALPQSPDLLWVQSPQSPVASEPTHLRACDASDPRSPQSLRCLRIHVASGSESSLSVSNLRAPGVSWLMSPHSWCHLRQHCLAVLPPRSLVTSQDASSSSRSAPAQRCCPLPSLHSSDLKPEHHSTRNLTACFLPGN